MTELESAVMRRTLSHLGGAHGPYKGRKLIVTLERGDMITIRPEGTRVTETLSLFDVYEMAVIARANRAKNEKLMNRKLKRKKG